MELRHLRHFVAVAEELHFARAADRLGMEQSPLSHSIRNLEAELGVPLFNRTTRKTWLTRAGTRFYTEAVRILDAAERAKATLVNKDYEPLTRLAVGLAEHSAGEPFTRFLFELEHRTPPVSVDLREIAPAEAVVHIEERTLDLAIVREPVDFEGLRCTRAWAEALRLIAPFGNPFSERDEVSMRELAGHRFVLAHPTALPGYAAQVQALVDRYEIRPAQRSLVRHQNTMVSLASTGRGLAFLPDSIAHGLTTVAVVPISEDDAEIVSWIVYREEDASDGVSFALEVAAVIDKGEDLLSSAMAAP